MYGERRPEFDPEQLLRNLRRTWERIGSRLPVGGMGLPLFAIFGVALLLWLATGFYNRLPI